MTGPGQDPAQAARRRAASVAAVGALFLTLGVLDVYRGLAPLASPGARLAADDQVLAVGVAALVGGVGVVRGRRSARWLHRAWMALHVVISARRPAELAAHVLIFGAVTFLLF